MEQIWAIEFSNKIKDKYSKVVERNLNKIPYSAVDGVFDDLSEKDICWWTNGFYGGMLWQLYHATQIDRYKKEAYVLEKKLDKVLMNYRGMDHDSGFRFLLTAVADYEITGNDESKNRGLLAAANLAGRFNPCGNYIRAWNDDCSGENAGWAIIDCMMNLPLLYWATNINKEARFYNIAVRYAYTVLENVNRDD